MAVRPATRVAVVGAGMGGLAAAITLAAEGCRVQLIERAEVAGGRMREFAVRGHPIDSGPTVFTMKDVFEHVFCAAGTRLEDHLELLPVSTLARHGWLDGSRLDLFSDIDRTAAAIEQFAGAREANGYRRFSHDAGDIYATLNTRFMRSSKPNPVHLALSDGLHGIPALIRTRPFRSMWSQLDHYFKDPRLHQLFARYATYCGSSPLAAPATLNLIAHVERTGVWRVKGGMQRLAEAMCALAERLGVELHLGDGVRQIRCKGARVSGVLLDSDRLIDCDAVIFNGDVNALSKALLGKAIKRAVPDRRREQRSLSAVTWSMVTRASGFELDHHTVLFGDDYAREFNAIFKEHRLPDDPTLYLCAQDRGESNALPTGEERLFMLVNAPPRPLKGSELRQLEMTVQRRLERHGLTLNINDVIRQTPDDFAARFPGSDGAIYGWPTHGWRGSFKRMGNQSSRINGLYFAGGSVHPGPGVPMAALSGTIAADTLMRDFAVTSSTPSPQLA